MTKEMVLLLAEDDPGHAFLVKKNLKRAGIVNPIQHFKDGQECLDFLFQRDQEPGRKQNTSYLLLLDIRMPKIDGIELLRLIKKNKKISKMPVIMLTTTDDPKDIELCYKLGCNNYITKPIKYDKFVNAIKRLGFFLSIVEFPKINSGQLQ